MEASKDKLLEELRDKARLRNKMGGALYFNVLNDECCKLANECLNAGIDKAVISEILGPDNFIY